MIQRQIDFDKLFNFRNPIIIITSYRRCFVCHMSINAFSFSSFNQSSASTFAIFTENGSAICVSYASRKCFTVIGLWSVGWCDGCLLPAPTMRWQLDRFDFRIGPTTVALVKSTDDDRLWCDHTMRFSSFRRLCVQQKTKIAWCEPGLRVVVSIPWSTNVDIVMITEPWIRATQGHKIINRPCDKHLMTLLTKKSSVINYRHWQLTVGHAPVVSGVDSMSSWVG